MKQFLIVIFLVTGVMIEIRAQWTTSNLSQAREFICATSSGTKVFFAAGELGASRSNVVDIYDNSTNTWSTATLSQARRSVTATSVGTKVFFAGGYSGTTSVDVVDVYDNSTNTWSTATLSEGRNSLASASVGTKAFFAGGINASNLRSDVVDIYDNSTNTWSTATLSQARDDLTATSLGTKVFFAGGNTSTGRSNVVDIYDNSTNTWSTATLSLARYDLCATSAGSKVFFAGGNAGSKASRVDIYDNSTNTWSTALLSQARDRLAATSVGNNVFFAGGNSGAKSNVVDIYNVSTNTWSTSTLPEARDNLAGASVGGKAFFGGGNNGAISSVVDIYSSTSVTFNSLTTGIAPSPLTATNLDVALAGFSIVSTGTSNIADVSISTSRNIGSDFSNFQLVSSVDASFSTFGDNLLLSPSVSLTAGAIIISGINESLSASARNYFLIADVSPTVTTATPTIQFSINQNDVIVSSGAVNAFSINSLTYSFQSNFSPEPTAQPTNLTFSPVGNRDLTLNYTAATGNPDGYIIVRREGSLPTTDPVDGTPYSALDPLGDGEVIYAGNATTVPENFLTEAITYFYKVYSYNGSGSTTNYLTVTPLSGSQTTGNYTYYSRQSGNWNDPVTWSVISSSGPPASDIPMATGSTAIVSTGTVVTLTIDTNIGGSIEIMTGSTLNAAGNDISMFGSLDIDGALLNAGTLSGYATVSSSSGIPVFDKIVYSFVVLNTDVVALNGVEPEDLVGEFTFDPGTFIVYPCIPPSNSILGFNPLFTNLNGTSMTLSWTNPGSGADGVVVVARVGGTSVKPLPGSSYTANSTFGIGSETVTGSLNYVVYQGTGNTVTITGLTPNTVYTFGIYQLNGTNCYNIRTMLEPSQNSGINPPPVLTFNPLNAATNVSVSGNITITASEAIRKLDNSLITSSDLLTLVELKLINNAGAGVPFTATIDGTRTIITIDPSTNLTSSTVYYVELNSVEDVDNIATTAQSITFTTGDAVPPTVTITPLNSSTNISTTTNIVLTFSEAIRNLDNSVVTNANVSSLLTLKLTNAAGANIPFTATINGAKTIITIDPTSTLADLSVIYFALSNVEDNSDNALSPSPQSITFTTNDATPPAVVFAPANSATSISTASNITLTFSEAIRNLDNSSVTDANVSSLLTLKLTNASGANIPFVATINGSKTVITIDPTVSLAELSVIYVAINGVEDNFDNAISPSPQNITFTTGDTTLPTLVFSPLNTTTNVSPASNVILTFSEAIRNLDNTALTNANVSSLLTLKLTNASGSNIPFTATINGTKTIITIDPTSTLPDLSVIYLAVNNIEDNSDNSISPSLQSITFTTGDATAPVTSFIPLSGTVSVSVDANIQVTFNEPVQRVDGTPITNANAADLFIFKLNNASGASVPFTTTINGSKTVITIDPTSTLLPNQLYFLRYDVVQDAAGNVTTTGSITFTTQAGPSITNISPLSACVGQSLTITGSNFGAATPTVSVNSVSVPVTAHTATSITIVPTIAVSGVVTVTNTDLSLSAISGSTLTVSSLPNIFSVTGGGAYCVGSNGVTIGLSNSQSGIEYEVYLGPTATGVKATPGGGAFNFTGFFTAAGIYSVKGKNAGNCSSDMSGSAIVQINDVPSGTGSISGSTIICQEESVDLTAVGFVNALTYEWTLASGLITTSSASGSVITVTGAAAPGGKVIVVARNNCGLSSEATTSITINPLPVISIEAPPANEQIVNDILQFTPTVDLPVTSYEWNFGDGGSSSDATTQHTYAAAGDFTVSLLVKTDAGCDGSASVNLSVSEFPFLSTNAIKNVVTANEDGKNDRLIVLDIERFPNNTVSVIDRWGVEVFNQDAYNNEWDFKKGGNYLPVGNYICIVKLNDSGEVITRTITLVKK